MRFLADDLVQHELSTKQTTPRTTPVSEAPVFKLQRAFSAQTVLGKTQDREDIEPSGKLTRSISAISDRSKSVRFYENVTLIDDRSISPLHALDKAPTLQASLENIFSDQSSAESLDSNTTGSASFSPPISDSEQEDIPEEEVAVEATHPVTEIAEQVTHQVTLKDRILAYQAATDELHREVERFRVLTSPQTPITQKNSSPQLTLFEESEKKPTEDSLRSESKEPSPVVVEERHSVSELLKSWERAQTPSSSPAKPKAFQQSPHKSSKSICDDKTSTEKSFDEKSNSKSEKKIDIAISEAPGGSSVATDVVLQQEKISEKISANIDETSALIEIKKRSVFLANTSKQKRNLLRR